MKLIYQGHLLNNEKQLLRDALKRHPTPLNDPNCVVAVHLVLHESPHNVILQEQTKSAREAAKEAQTQQQESLLASSPATTSSGEATSTTSTRCCSVM